MKERPSDFLGYVFAVLVTSYLILTFGLPVNKVALTYYHISILHLRLLELSAIIPIVIIWITAFYGFSKLHNYSRSIYKDSDGKGMMKIAYGIGVLAIGGPFNSVASTILNSVASSHPSFISKSTVISNYLTVVAALAAFILMSQGARNLSDSVKARPSNRVMQLLILLSVIITSLFCYLIFRNLPRALALGINGKPNYYLPNWLTLTTIVMPYSFIWISGGLAIVNVQSFYIQVKGRLYRDSLRFIAIGMGFFIFSEIALQYLSALSSKLLSLKIVDLLMIIYPLIIIISVGYIFVALGAKKLRKIEES